MGIPLSEIPVLSIKKYTAPGPFTIDNTVVVDSDIFSVNPVLTPGRFYFAVISYIVSAIVGAPTEPNFGVYDNAAYRVLYSGFGISGAAPVVTGKFVDQMVTPGALWPMFFMKQNYEPLNVSSILPSSKRVDSSKFYLGINSAPGANNSYKLINIELDIIDLGLPILDQF